MSAHLSAPPAGTSRSRLSVNITGDQGQGAHGWLMIACCIPMIVIVVALVATGVASAGLLVAAIACTTMMAIMMRGMDHRAATGGDAHASSTQAPRGGGGT